MPELVRLYIRSVALGFAISAVFTAGLVWWNVAGIGHLILGSDIGLVAAAMLVASGSEPGAVNSPPSKSPSRHRQGPRR